MQSDSIFSVFLSAAVQIYVAGKVAWPVKALKSGICQIWKKFQNPEIFVGLSLFSDVKNFTIKFP
jgi:hypothetical protein